MIDTNIKWTLENIKKYLENNNSCLLSSDEDYYKQLNKNISPLKIKLDVKCFNCEEGVIYRRDIDHIVNRKQNNCKKCSKKILSNKMSKQNKEWWKSKEYRQKVSERTTKNFTGIKNPNYKIDLTDEEREIQRNTIENVHWRNDIYKRDNYTCQCCGDNSGGNLEAHHLYNWSENKKLRYDINNGITLCETCHKKFHSLYGYKNNTKEQFKEFLNLYKQNNNNTKIIKRKRENKKTCNVIGVNWEEKSKTWSARINIYGKEIWLYSSKNINEVITIRLIAENQYLKDAAPQKELFDIYNICKYKDVDDFKSKHCKIKGVYKHNDKWIAMINKNNYLGMFKDYNKAVKARLNKEKELYGDKAPQSFLFKKYDIH